MRSKESSSWFTRVWMRRIILILMVATYSCFGGSELTFDASSWEAYVESEDEIREALPQEDHFELNLALIVVRGQAMRRLRDLQYRGQLRAIEDYPDELDLLLVRSIDGMTAQEAVEFARTLPDWPSTERLLGVEPWQR